MQKRLAKTKPKIVKTKKFVEKVVPISPIIDEKILTPDEFFKQKIIQDIKYRAKSVRQCCAAYFKGKVLVRNCRFYQ